MRRGSVLSMVCAALALAGCGGSDGDTTAITVLTLPADTNTVPTHLTPTTEAQPTASSMDRLGTTAADRATEPVATIPATRPWPPSQQLLDEAMLTISDMPTGWASVADDGEDRDPPCGVGMARILGMESEDWPRGEVQFAEDEDTGPLVLLSASVIPPASAHIDLLGTFLTEVLDCEDTLDGAKLSYSELSYPQTGDQSIAIRQRAELPNDGPTIDYDIVVVRVDDVIVQIAGVDVFGDATAILDEFVQPAVDRAVEVLGA